MSTDEASRFLPAVLQLLQSADPSLVLQGVELAGSLEDPALFEALLEGVESGARHEFLRALQEGAHIPAWAADFPYRDLALLGVVGTAPDTCATAARLRTQVEDIWLTSRPVPGLPLPLRWLARFQAVESMSLDGFLLQDLPALSLLPHLERLRLKLPQKGAPPLDGLNLPQLQELTLEAWGLSDLRGLSEGLPGLRRLILKHFIGASLDAPGRMGSLRGLTVRSCPRVVSLAPLQGLERLKRLGLERLARLASLASLGAPPLLDTLRVEHLPLLTRLDLPPLPSLHTLHLDENPALTSLSPQPALRTLWLHRQGGPLLEGHEALPALARLEIIDAPRLDLRPLGQRPLAARIVQADAEGLALPPGLALLELNLSNPRVLPRLPEGLVALRFVWQSGGEEVGEKMAQQALAQCPRLAVLDVNQPGPPFWPAAWAAAKAAGVALGGP